MTQKLKRYFDEQGYELHAFNYCGSTIRCGRKLSQDNLLRFLQQNRQRGGRDVNGIRFGLDVCGGKVPTPTAIRRVLASLQKRNLVQTDGEKWWAVP